MAGPGGIQYSDRLDQAVALALADFRQVSRKAVPVPYISHLFAVTSFVAEGGGDEDQLVAAMLHDWLEDVPSASGERLEGMFGPRVRRLVEAVTDTTEHPKPPWRERKERFLETIRNESADVKLICTADKLHNAQCLARDLAREGVASLDRFRGGRDGTLWYYRSVTDALADKFDHWLLEELDKTVTRVASLAR